MQVEFTVSTARPTARTARGLDTARGGDGGSGIAPPGLGSPDSTTALGPPANLEEATTAVFSDETILKTLTLALLPHKTFVTEWDVRSREDGDAARETLRLVSTRWKRVLDRRCVAYLDGTTAMPDTADVTAANAAPQSPRAAGRASLAFGPGAKANCSRILKVAKHLTSLRRLSLAGLNLDDIDELHTLLPSKACEFTARLGLPGGTFGDEGLEMMMERSALLA